MILGCAITGIDWYLIAGHRAAAALRILIRMREDSCQKGEIGLKF